MIVVGGVYVFQRKLLYFPSKTTPVLNSLDKVYSEVQTQTKDHLSLTHWLAKRGQTYVVVFHGNTGNIEDRGHKFKFLADQGFSVLLVGYRGYGDNSGRPTEKNFIADSTLVLEWLIKKEGIPLKEIALFGESLGSGTAIALAAHYPVKAVIIEGAFSSISDIARSVYPFLPVRWMLKDTWDSQSRIQKVKSPILFIHSKTDSVTPFRFVRKLFQAANEPKKYIWLEDSGHSDSLEKEFVKKTVIDFLQSNL